MEHELVVSQIMGVVLQPEDLGPMANHGDVFIVFNFVHALDHPAQEMPCRPEPEGHLKLAAEFHDRRVALWNGNETNRRPGFKHMVNARDPPGIGLHPVIPHRSRGLVLHRVFQARAKPAQVQALTDADLPAIGGQNFKSVHQAAVQIDIMFGIEIGADGVGERHLLLFAVTKRISHFFTRIRPLISTALSLINRNRGRFSGRYEG